MSDDEFHLFTAVWRIPQDLANHVRRKEPIEVWIGVRSLLYMTLKDEFNELPTT